MRDEESKAKNEVEKMKLEGYDQLYESLNTKRKQFALKGGTEIEMCRKF